MSQSKPEYKVCIACTNPAELVCSRCRDNYCSVECQRADWVSHREICFRMPPLLTRLDLDAVGQKFNTNLNISCSVDSVPSLHASKTSTETPTKRVEARKENAPVTTQKEIGTVQSAPKNESKTPDQPKKIEPLKAPVPPTQVPTQAMKHIVNRGPQKFNPIAKKPAAPERITLDDMPHRVWPKTKNIKVKLICALEQSVMVLCEENEEISQIYEAVAEEIKNFVSGKKQEDYKPIKGEVVLAMFENEWYRAFVVKPDHEDGIIVKYIDFGNVEVVKPSDIIPIGESLKLDVCTRDYKIENYSDKLTQKQLEILESGAFTITNVSQGEGNVWNCSIFGF